MRYQHSVGAATPALRFELLPVSSTFSPSICTRWQSQDQRRCTLISSLGTETGDTP